MKGLSKRTKDGKIYKDKISYFIKMEQEMVEIPKRKLEAMEEELKILRNPQIVEEIKESLESFRKGKGRPLAF